MRQMLFAIALATAAFGSANAAPHHKHRQVKYPTEAGSRPMQLPTQVQFSVARR